MDRAVDAANLGVSAAGDLSVWALFMNASLVVKLVMLGLLLCSIMVWAIIIDKFVTIRRINARLRGLRTGSGPVAALMTCTKAMAQSP